MDIFCLGAFANLCASNNAQWLTELGGSTKPRVIKKLSQILRGPENEKREEKYW
jgi:hypothetical protein